MWIYLATQHATHQAPARVSFIAWGDLHGGVAFVRIRPQRVSSGG
jgi:hypothetical protein